MHSIKFLVFCYIENQTDTRIHTRTHAYTHVRAPCLGVGHKLTVLNITPSLEDCETLTLFFLASTQPGRDMLLASANSRAYLQVVRNSTALVSIIRFVCMQLQSLVDGVLHFSFFCTNAVMRDGKSRSGDANIAEWRPRVTMLEAARQFAQSTENLLRLQSRSQLSRMPCDAWIFEKSITVDVRRKNYFPPQNHRCKNNGTSLCIVSHDFGVGEQCYAS
jgi:hypothetical protein